MLCLSTLLSKTPFATIHTLLPHPLQPWTPFWWKDFSCCAYMQLSLTLKTLRCANLPSWLVLMTIILSLLLYYPQIPVALLTKRVYPEPSLQLVILLGHAFYQLFMKELYNSVTVTYLGAKKLTYSLFTRVW